MAPLNGRSGDLPAPWRDDHVNVLLARHWARVADHRLDLAARPSDMHVHLAEVTFRLSLLRQMTDHAIAHDSHFHQFMLFTPVPGTPLSRRRRKALPRLGN